MSTFNSVAVFLHSYLSTLSFFFGLSLPGMLKSSGLTGWMNEVGLVHELDWAHGTLSPSLPEHTWSGGRLALCAAQILGWLEQAMLVVQCSLSSHTVYRGCLTHSRIHTARGGEGKGQGRRGSVGPIWPVDWPCTTGACHAPCGSDQTQGHHWRPDDGALLAESSLWAICLVPIVYTLLRFFSLMKAVPSLFNAEQILLWSGAVLTWMHYFKTQMKMSLALKNHFDCPNKSFYRIRASLIETGVFYAK